MKNCFLFLSLLSFSLWAQPAKILTPPGYAIASAHPLATQAGLEIFAKGGNAFDAAIAVSAVLGVVAPYHSGLGGGSFWLLHEGKSRKSKFIDAREKAPLAAREKMFLDAQGKVIEGASLNGGLAAAIPGQPAAFVYVASHFGRLPLEKSLAPAIRLAEEGFIVDHQFWTFSSISERLQQLRRFPATAKIFLKNGEPYPIGSRLIQKDLANTLKILAKQGKAGFYQGAVAQKLVDGVNAAGGIWTLNDLADYDIALREPLKGLYHDMVVITSPLPSAGGIALITSLNILSFFPLQNFSKLQWIHYLVESMRLSYWQRAEYLGDSDFVSVPVARLISYPNAKSLANRILPTKPTPSQSLPHRTMDYDESLNTTHFSILDKEGNRVSVTQTVNYLFGSSVVAEGTGIILNDEMDDFSTKPGVKNVFGVVGSKANAIAPGKRPLSSMAPTFLETADRVAILGTPGGSRIPTMLLLSSLIFEKSYGAISMVSAMRFHHQYLPDELQFEPDTFSAPLQKALTAMGYHLTPLAQYYGDMQAITWDKENQVITAASDPRRIGMAAAITAQKQGYGVKY